MMGLDTHVLVRYIMQDDAKQSAQAVRLLDALSVEKPGFVTLVSVVELVWVLSSCYDLNRTQLVTALEALLRTKELVIENAEVVWRAVRLFRDSSGDFADFLVERSAAAAGCFQTMTFDRGAVKNCGMVLVP
jgi:predicted nucleic-acid-binding protein